MTDTRRENETRRAILEVALHPRGDPSRASASSGRDGCAAVSGFGLETNASSRPPRDTLSQARAGVK